MKIITIILLFFAVHANAQDTTYLTYEITHDSLSSTTIGEQLIPRDTTYVVFDTSYRTFYDMQLYSLVDGSVSVIATLYDTIPAYDTTFICHLCATHDTTVMLITPEPEVGIYGLFPNTGGTLDSRLNLTVESGSNAFRDNYNWGQQWQVEEVHDKGLIALTTYNDPPCCQGNYFHTGAALTQALARLDSTLAVERDNNNLPEIISFNNEEPNFGYWKGTATDYVNWFNAAAEIAHSYGIPVSTGGLLHNMLWYVRYIYQQEGKTDSVAMINASEGWGPSTPTFAQTVIDWYKIEIPGIVEKSDYLNFHFYNPKTKDDAISTPTDGMAILINFLGRYGKEIITTETGTNNHNQTLFNAHMDTIKDMGVDIIIYYLGTGNLSEENLSFWEQWIINN